MNPSTEKPSKTNDISLKQPKKSHRMRGCFLYTAIGTMLVCVLAAGLSALSNSILPAHSQETGTLSALDKARLAEALHLRNKLGDDLWPGWS